jgi:hypothetical protein
LGLSKFYYARKELKERVDWCILQKWYYAHSTFAELNSEGLESRPSGLFSDTFRMFPYEEEDGMLLYWFSWQNE